jgi:HlyD family secretion protein
VQDNKVFRQAALDRLASPEQLHTLMRVTDAKGWLALAGCVLLVGTAVAWGFLGSVPSKLQASGILIHSGGLADVVAVGSGQITALEVDVGDTVKKGQVVAHVAQPELKEQLAGLKARHAELQANYQKAKQAGGRDVSLRMQASSQAVQNLQMAIQANEQRTRELEERLEKQTRLHEKGLVTNDALDSTRESLRAARVSMQTMRADKERLAVDDFSAKRMNEAALMSETMQVQETERQIKLLEENLQQNSRVVSTHEGRVVEVRAMTGDLIQPGMPIVSLERTGDKASLEALLYVDSKEGKILSPGMEVQIEPTIVRKERHGVLIGAVRAVESFPSTRQGMMRVLKNEQLVQSFLAETAGTPIAVRAELIREPTTASGFRWSSGGGPDLVLTSGTRCLAQVTTRTQRPIALVLPALDFGG